jgi:hypothetical protein
VQPSSTFVHAAPVSVDIAEDKRTDTAIRARLRPEPHVENCTVTGQVTWYRAHQGKPRNPCVRGQVGRQFWRGPERALFAIFDRGLKSTDGSFLPATAVP